MKCEIHMGKGLSEGSSCNTHRVFMHTRAVPRTRCELEVQNCRALRQGQAFPVFLKQKPVHVHTVRLYELVHLIKSYLG